jgi:hypothetical protein
MMIGNMELRTYNVRIGEKINIVPFSPFTIFFGVCVPWNLPLTKRVLFGISRLAVVKLMILALSSFNESFSF